MNPDWKAKVGEGTAVNWPTGAGGKGNEGVSSYVQRLPNSIGYVEYAYAKQNKMTHTLLKNKAGNFVAAGFDDNFKAAAAGADWCKTFFQVLTDQPGKDAWPISGATFILMHKAQDKPANAANSLKFFDWAYRQRRQDGRRPGVRALAGLGQGRWCARSWADEHQGHVGQAGRLRSERDPSTVQRRPLRCQLPWPLHCPPRRFEERIRRMT